MRKFHIHDEKPAALETTVTVRDAEMAPRNNEDNGQVSYVAYTSIAREMQRVCGPGAGVSVRLNSTEAEVVSFVRLESFGDVEFGPIGLTGTRQPNRQPKCQQYYYLTRPVRQCWALTKYCRCHVGQNELRPGWSATSRGCSS
eukprot:scaffold72188_cov49-Prasinocladus_malaysianus.AAC.1